jgi:D-inositol-3-phosphate glycosyltransferase
MTISRVAVISYHSSPLAPPGSGDGGGMTVYVRSVAAALAREGIHTDIFTRASGEARPITRIDDRVRVISVEAGSRTGLIKDRLPDFIDEFTSGIRAFAQQQRVTYDILHSHYWQSGIAGADLASLWRIPLVHSHHTLGRVKNGARASGDVIESVRRVRGEEAIAGAADAQVASTSQEWRQLLTLYRAASDSVKVIHPGVDHALFFPIERTDARAELKTGPGPVLLSVGRIQPLKGIDLAIRAVPLLGAETTARPTLIVVGGASGPRGEQEEEKLRALADNLGISDLVRFVGPQPHEVLATYYSAADALIVGSHSESFGLTALEAHACGTPVIGTAVGGLPDVVDHGASGFLLPQRDPTIVAARVRHLVDQSVRARFRSRAIERAARFSWKKTAASFLELYECLVRADVSEECVC